MNLDSIIKIANTEPEVFEQTGKRRDLLKSFGSKVVLAALPLAFGELFSKKAKAQNINAIIETLNFGLTVELMQAEFHKQAFDIAGLIPADTRDAFAKIKADAAGHVGAITYFINDLGGTPIGSINFDYTGGAGFGAGPFQEVFSKYETFLEVAQIFADLSVRAYKEIITNVLPQDDVVYNMMNIHSVKARHAAHIRFTRKDVKPWVTSNNSEIINPGSVSTYAEDENTNQFGINMINLNGFILSNTTVTQAFDEPMPRDKIMNIVNKFIAP